MISVATKSVHISKFNLNLQKKLNNIVNKEAIICLKYSLQVFFSELMLNLFM